MISGLEESCHPVHVRIVGYSPTFQLPYQHYCCHHPIHKPQKPAGMFSVTLLINAIHRATFYQMILKLA